MDNNFLASFDNIDFTTAVGNLVKKSCIIDFGIIRKVVAKGIVDVELSVASTKEDIVCLTCVLANISSSSFTIDIEPTVGDKVIVFYPRRYDGNMFDVDNDKVIVKERVSGYNLLSGIALLFNQYRKNKHKNFIHIKDGIVEYSLNNNKVTLDLSTDKEIKIQDSNGCTITSSSSDININGKLTIKKG